MRRDQRKRDWMRFRFFLLLAGIILAMGAVLVQAYRIQIHHGEKLRQEVQRLYQREITLMPSRGSIFDRNGEDLAISIPVQSIYARPPKVRDPAHAARQLAPLLEQSASTLLETLQKDAHFVWLKRQVVPPVSARIQAMGLPGVGVIQETRRFYPNLELACHLLGFVGVDPRGLEGLEYQYDRLLRGEKHRMVVDQDAFGRPLAPSEGLIVSRNDGHHLVLTIHKQIQHVVEQYLEDAVQATQASSGMAVVLAPQTGEILAMANVPRFNPNTFTQYPRWVLRNRCITDLYEPGSTFKPILVAAALEEEEVEPSDIIFCENGTYRVFDKVIHDVQPHRWLTIKGILQRSSNIGAAKVGLSLGPERLYRHIQGFGFGRPTGVDIPGEAAGMVRPPHMWSPVDLATISFGQGISTTALQVATAFAAFANEGHRMKPYVVKEILDSQGHTVERRGPKDLGLVVSPKTARQVTRMLTAVVDEQGTGAQAAMDGFRVAGKTGTSQKPDLRSGGYYKGRYLASFAGFVPVDDPRLCIVVVLDEPQGNVHGGQIAAPIFRNIAEDALGILGVAPDRRLIALGPSGR